MFASLHLLTTTIACKRYFIKLILSKVMPIFYGGLYVQIPYLVGRSRLASILYYKLLIISSNIILLLTAMKILIFLSVWFYFICVFIQNVPEIVFTFFTHSVTNKKGD